MSQVSEIKKQQGMLLKPLALILLVALLGAQCGFGPSTPTGIADPFPKENLTLEIWRPFNEEAAFQDIIVNYRTQHPNVSFKFRTIEPENYEAELLNALASNNGPDIVSLPNDAIPKFSDKLVEMPTAFFPGESNPITSMSTKYAPAVVTDAVQENKVYGVPLYTDTLALYWNRDIFQKKFQQFVREERQFNQDLLIRAPIDWNEVVELTKLITERNGDTINLSAIALGDPDTVPFSGDIIAALLLQQNAPMVSADRREATFHLPDVNDPTFYPGQTALQFLKGFSDPASEYYTWGGGSSNAVDAFIEGKTAMMINYQSTAAYLKQRNPNLKFATSTLPQIINTRTIVDFARYHLEAVTNQSEYPQVAWDFLSFVTRTGLGIYKNTAQRPSPLRNSPATTTTLERAFSTTPFIMQIPTAQSWYKGRDPELVDTILEEALKQVLYGANARDSLDQASKKMTTLLAT